MLELQRLTQQDLTSQARSIHSNASNQTLYNNLYPELINPK